MNYDFGRFSPQSFERFAQAMACARLGAGTQIYGAGRDGAREATFEGKCSPDGGATTWDGYVVVQAKFLTEPKSTKEDLAWLKREVDKDLAKFEDKKRNLRQPNFYILVTNVILSAGAADRDGKRGGSLDAMRDHMAAWSTRLGLKGYYLWDGNVLSSFLDGERELRRTFSAWTTPGDVLAFVLESMCPPDFRKAASRLIRDELRECRNLKTRDSGQSQSRPLFIDEVFVDLPLVPSTVASHFDLADPDDGDEDTAAETSSEAIDSAATSSEAVEDTDAEADVEGDEDDNWNVVHTLMVRAADCLAPSKLLLKSKSRGPLPNRIVILGGPGQGKSTIGQFIAQLMRSRFVLGLKSAAPDLQEIATAVMSRTGAEEIFGSGPFRFPLHIELPNYADHISKHPGASIVAYIGSVASAAADENVKPKHVHEWLAAYPSMIILDGLDEVPRSGNRREVIRGIGKLVGDLHESDADALFVITSRPQGYLNDLDPNYWQHWMMAELDAGNAIRYFTRLSSVLISDTRRRTEVVDALSGATTDPATSPLMISPLQISLLFSLVETRNDIPRDRWTLFERHYEILRDREISKGGQSGDLIRNHRVDIDRIHYDSGFLLHVRAEGSGNADAHFSPSEFQAVVRRQIAQSFDKQEDIDRTTASIVEIATTRLVFLGAKNEDEIAFDVRSLQEFMAAARIMVSPESLIAPRLKEIAVKSHWEHVFKIACSKVYAQPALQDFRDEICRIMDRLDSGDEGMEYRTIRAGAKLAIMLLADSTAGSKPVERQELIRRAMRVLHILDEDARESLVKILDDRSLKTVESVVSENLAESGGISYNETLRLLLAISRTERHPLRSWAGSRAEAEVGRHPAVLPVLIDVPRYAASGEAEALYQRIAWAAGPDALARDRYYDEENLPAAAALPHAIYESSSRLIRVFTDGGEPTALRIRYYPVDRQIECRMAPRPDGSHRSWETVEALGSFYLEPSKATLAKLVGERLKIADLDFQWIFFPWPASEAFKQGGDASVIVNRILEGVFGDIDGWRAAEKRWSQGGVTFTEVAQAACRESLSDISTVGAPLTEQFILPPTRRVSSETESGGTLADVMEAFRQAGPAGRDVLLSAARLLARRSEGAQTLNAILEIETLCDLSALKAPSKRRLLDLALILPEESWRTGELERVVKAICPSDLVLSSLSTRSAPARLVELLDRAKDREWSARILFARMPRQRDKTRAWFGTGDVSLLRKRPKDSLDVQMALAAIRVALGDMTTVDIDETAGLLAKVPSGYASTLLHRLSSGADEDRALDSLIIAAALKILASGQGNRRSLTQLLEEILSARESRLSDIDFSKNLKLPETLPPPVTVEDPE